MKTLRLTLKRMLTVATVATLALGGALVTTSAANAAPFFNSTLSTTWFKSLNSATPEMTFNSVSAVTAATPQVTVLWNSLPGWSTNSDPVSSFSINGVAQTGFTTATGGTANELIIQLQTPIAIGSTFSIAFKSGAFTTGDSLFNGGSLSVMGRNLNQTVGYHDQFSVSSIAQGSYTISYDANGGSGSFTSEEKSTSSYSIPMSAFSSFTRTNHTLLGFSSDPNATAATYTTSSFTFSNPTTTTLYAVWKTPSAVTFDKNAADASGIMTQQSSQSGTSLTVNAFIRPGYNFMGWSTSPSATTPQYQNAAWYDFSASITLYAVWQANSTPDPTPQPSPGALATFNLAIAPNCAIDVNLVPQNFSLTGGFWALNSPASPMMYPAGLTVTTDGRLQGSISSPITYTTGQSFKSFPIVYYANGTSPSGPGLGYVIVQATNTSVCASNGGSNGGNTIPVINPRATAKIQLNLEIGEKVSNAPLSISSSALQPGAAYNVEVRSTPTVIASGKVSSSGTVSQTTNLPTNLEPGWHTIVFTSTAADGTPFVSKVYFEIAADGTLLASSQELAYTGASDNNWLGAIGVMALLAGALLFVVRRRIA